MRRCVISDSTRKSYAAAWNKFEVFCRVFPQNGNTKPYPVSSEHLINFIGYLNLNGYKGTTITSIVTAISFQHKVDDIEDPGQSFMVKKILKHLRAQSKRDVRKPITLKQLYDLICIVDLFAGSMYEAQLMKCVYVLMYTGMLRISEVFQLKNSCHQILFNNVCRSWSGYNVKLTSWKHSNGRNHVVQIKNGFLANTPISPAMILRDFLSIRPRVVGNLFVSALGTPFPVCRFLQIFKSSLNKLGMKAKHYKSHSFRIGGATGMHNQGYSVPQIMSAGRWSSTAWTRYIRQ